MKKTEEEIRKAAERWYGNTPGERSKNIFVHGAKWMQEQDNTELREKDLALGNAYRMLKQIDNIVGLSEPQKKRLEIISVTIKKYFNVPDCLRVTQSDKPPKH